ncbi:MAG: short chain dehydrogenase [Deltaproteobacteria bacterium HGW-Deltaproteobacteria-2]|jgi:NADP-dependent 3-hydroxy acid dehydrogenase YdfG|nr:MAG: short chain dehydrogenase [Deltaproteobacteria bacterium HGW-Deltaproteobacteria-2]
MRELQNKKVFITGAASGIGRATAIAMGKLGCRLFLTDINGDDLKKTVEVISNVGGTVCLARPFDVGNYQAMADFAKDVHAGFGSLDILINVAGIALFSQIEDMSHNDWEKVIKVNLWGAIHGLECFVPDMIRSGNGGHIVTISSTAGIIGLPWHVVYAGTKHALVGMSEVLRYDLKKHKIDVSVVCPGAVNTGLVKTVEIHADKEATDKARTHFLKRAISPEKVADLIIGAIRSRKFFVITSFDIKLLYFFKKYCFPIYHLIMLTINRFMDKSLKKAIEKK